MVLDLQIAETEIMNVLVELDILMWTYLKLLPFFGVGNMNLIYLGFDVQQEQRNPTLLFGRLFRKEHNGEKLIWSYYVGNKRV